MKSVVFLACIFLLTRASPTNEGARPPMDLFPLDLNKFVVSRALIIRPPYDHHFNTFDASFESEADDAVDELPSHPTLNLFPLSNDLHRSSETLEHECEPMRFNIIEKSNSDLQTARKYRWNDLKIDECKNMDVLISGTTDRVNNLVSDSEHPPGEEPLIHHDEPNAVNEHVTDTHEKVAEIIQSILLKGKNGRIYSQSKSAVLARNYLNLNPKAREACNVRQQKFREKRRALERALLETQHPSILADGEYAPERNGRGLILSQATDAIQSRRYRKEHPEFYKTILLNHKKRCRRKKAIALLETRTLRPDFKDRGDEFIDEYVECSHIGIVMSKWLLDESFSA